MKDFMYFTARFAVVLVGLFLCAVALMGQARSAITRWNGEYYVIDYGAVCNAGGDDSTAIQAAVTAAELTDGTVVFPRAGLCRIATTITVKDPADGTSFVSFRGTGSRNNSGLLWNGAEGGTALKFIRNKQFSVRNMNVRNNIATNGASQGIVLTGYGGIGTETLGSVFEHVTVEGFGIGLKIGESTGEGDALSAASSDNSFNSVVASNNTIGIKIAETNSLNNFFNHLQITGNTDAGLEMNGGGAHVTGGGSNGNGVDIRTDSVVNFYVKGFRAEVPDGGVFVQATGGYTVSIENCVVTDSDDATTFAVELLAAGQANFLNLINNTFLSRVLIRQAPRQMYMLNNQLWGDTSVPYFTAGTPGTVYGTFTNNIDSAGGVTPVTHYANSVVPR